MENTTNQVDVAENALAMLDIAEDAPQPRATKPAGIESAISRNKMRKQQKREKAKEVEKQRKAMRKQKYREEREKSMQEKEHKKSQLSKEERAAQDKRELELVMTIIEKRKKEHNSVRNSLNEVYNTASENFLNNIFIILDCSFESYMEEHECKSLVKQLEYCYAANLKMSAHMQPFHFSITSLTGLTLQHISGKTGYSQWVLDRTDKHFLEYYTSLGVPKEKIIYLTADADDEIQELEPGYAYVLGAIVDRNRYPKLCWEVANKQGLRTARLPLRNYVQLKTSAVLTTNQCFELLSYFQETKDWQVAVDRAIPERKKVIKEQAEDTATTTTSTTSSSTDE